MSKIFSECAWEDDFGTSFSFSKKVDSQKPKEKKTKDTPRNTKRNENRSTTDKPIGWSVLLSQKGKCNGTTVPESIGGSKKQDKKSTKPNGKRDVAGGQKRKATMGNGLNASTPSATKDMKIPQKKRKLNDNVSSNGIPKNGTAKGERPAPIGANESQSLAPNETKGNTSEKRIPVTGPASLRDKLVERLKGSRFRFINEQLYKSTGEEAKKLFQEDPDSFMAYHEGYRHQIAQWSMNPLDRMIKSIRKLPKNTVVADFGCGEGRLAQSIPNQTYSLDLVAHNSSVIACDMANTPLESNFVNVVVFCLSLMGTNLADFFLEANRVLKNGGLLKIAEVSSRFDKVKEFEANVKKCGFQLVNTDMKHKLFYFFTFKKDRTVLKGSLKIPQFSLKPCLYKKR